MNIDKVIEIFSETRKESSLPRPIVRKLNLIENHGIEFDKFALKNLEQTVLLVGINSYNLALENDIKIEFGTLGENILVSFDPHKYDIGTKFKIGDDAMIELTQICTVCNHLSIFDKKLPILLKEKRGVYCKIVKSGLILKNMTIKRI
ncbi:MOSC domain-containing protein [Aliarcobacter thereius]|uniref:MOSC domain-containing protein n=1 Tax=Aliarcobacter thereius TaxID=544718 RepID=UPI0010FED978|nr:MOSC domain-containing protein [Aliarcobacter thereius]TLT08461.1 MOSC domain-containing protein [Aliarcobacter thereius]